MFTNLQFTPSRSPPPDTKPRECWIRAPALCTGIVLFDILIGNDDRNSWNLAVDVADSPNEIICHDHDCAIASDLYGEARKRFRTQKKNFLAENHCLIKEITSDAHINHWIGRIQKIPVWFIEDICGEAISKGFGTTTAKLAAEFLCWRSKYIDDLVRENKDKFEGISVWTVII